MNCPPIFGDGPPTCGNGLKPRVGAVVLNSGLCENMLVEVGVERIGLLVTGALMLTGGGFAIVGIFVVVVDNKLDIFGVTGAFIMLAMLALVCFTGVFISSEVFSLLVLTGPAGREELCGSPNREGEFAIFAAGGVL